MLFESQKGLDLLRFFFYRCPWQKKRVPFPKWTNEGGQILIFKNRVDPSGEWG